MTETTVVLVLVVVTALGFDFTNGFHDTANAMATSIATGALRPKVAVLLSAVLNLVGAFLSVEVALTVTNAVVRIQNSDGIPKPELLSDGGRGLLLIVLAGLVGGILWNLLTWLLGLPSSSSHALFGGLIGSAVAGLGWSGVKWTGDGSKLDGVVGKVILPALMSPVIAGLVAAAGTWIIYRITAGVAARFAGNGFRWGQIGSASLRDRLDPGKRRRQARCAGALGGRRPHGGGVADHAARGGRGGRADVVRRRPDRRTGRRAGGLRRPGGPGRPHVPALAPAADRPQQRQRRVGRPGRRAEGHRRRGELRGASRRSRRPAPARR
ncbi:anion permease [Actinoplanes siamensis]|uniref:anion permease n=1 Tax=Actinoplanes siamensis TaxID=1223317 RepID=UPI0040390838